MKWVNLAEICDFQGGSQPPKDQWIKTKKSGYIRMLQIRDFTQQEQNEYVPYSRSLKLCKKNDVLIARYGASVGKILTGLSGAYNVALMRAIPDKRYLNSRYLLYYLKGNYFQKNLKVVGCRAAQQGFNKNDLKKFKIPLPPLETQKKIVQVLDKAQELIDKRKEQIEKLDKFIQSVFLDMFGDPVFNKKEWLEKKLSEKCDIYRGGSPRPIKKYLDGNVPWIKIGDASKGDSIYLHKTKEFIIEEGVKKSRLVKKGSLIFANCGVSLGFARIITFNGCIHDGWLSMENINEDINKIFLLKLLNFYTNYFRNIAPDGTQPNLNTTIMKNFKIIVPPIELQNKFAAVVGKVEEEKELMQESLQEMENNFNSLMQRAFKGELF